MSDKKVNISFACDKWNSMSKIDEQNRYCSSCDKVIHDFSKSKQTISKDIYCGHFDLSQVDSIKNSFSFSRTGVYAISLLSAIGISSIQNKSYAQDFNCNSEKKVDKNKIVLNGVIKDLIEKESLPFVNIILLSDSKEIYTTNSDFDGNFCIEIDTLKYDINNIKIKFQYVGYDDLYLNPIVFNKKESSIIVNLETNINMNRDSVQVHQYILSGIIDKE